MYTKTIFVSADLGYSLTYFLQSDVVPYLRAANVRIVLLTDDGFVNAISRKDPGLIPESLRFDQCRQYARSNHEAIQHWLHTLRAIGGSQQIGTGPMDGHLQRLKFRPGRSTRRVLPFLNIASYALRRSKTLRRWLVRTQNHFTASIYGDLFDRYQPDMVISASPGWRLDRYLLREAAARDIPTATAIVGWDNPSSYRIPGASVQHATCWSEIQKDELIQGCDWNPDRIHIGGIPSYDGYLRGDWAMPREEYFKLHGLDPQRRLVSYACSFVTFSPNYANVAALAEMIGSGQLCEPSQLLIRLHPSHFHSGTVFEEEAQRIRELARAVPHVHVVEPTPLGGEMRYYSGEDMHEKASMLTHSDVFVTVYSTMVVEAAIHDRPIISACIDLPGGWRNGEEFSLSFRQIGHWPTHRRFRESNAGRVAFDPETLLTLVNRYLREPWLDRENRKSFIEKECTFTDASAGQRTAGYFLRLLGLE